MNAESPGFGVEFRTIEVSNPRFEAGNLRCVTVKSAALSQRVDVTACIPPEVREAPNAPLIILLHGVYGSHWSWMLQGGAAQTADRLVAASEIPPCVIATPSDGLWGDGSGYLPHRLQDFERWIVFEVPAAVAHTAPEVTPRSPVFIGGLSMGGFGALRLAAKYPQHYRAVSGHSSITHFDQLSQFVEERLGAYTAMEEDRSVLATMLRHRDKLPPIRFDCGMEDPLLVHNRVLHQSLTEAGIAHTYEEFSGGHEWSYWEAHLADTLRFFAKHL